VTRQNHKNEPKDGWRSEQSISTQEALRSFTIDAAWAAHQEKILGGLTVGKWADFIIIDRDIFSVPKEEIWKTKVLETWVAGKLAYERS
jgi:predicted amidohydrolase YtcJ